ncbi:MFS general substrate transporter [Cytidiella melzeri]|nr:MFS general substrate transporter [Cytidiella melzeri]
MATISDSLSQQDSLNEKRAVLATKKEETASDGGDDANLERESYSAHQGLTQAEEQPNERPYSVYSLSEKWAIVAISSIAGIFSPLTANIYFPAIPELSRVFGKSVELINLTVTMYMVLQGFSPMLWGTLADRWGRRLMFLACMLVLSLACVGLALVPTNAYWLLMVLRCLQAAGSASTIALGAGVIGDIATRAERGGFFGLYSIGPMFGPCLGPVIGGALSQGLGWRSIFWFLCIGSALCFVVMLCDYVSILPETLRAMVGDGSIQPPPLYRPLFPIIGRKHAGVNVQDQPPKKKFQNPLRIFLYPDITLLLIFNATPYCVMYGVTASISTLFSEIYPFLSQTDIGLCFLAIGGGMTLGSVTGGKILDKDYQRIKRNLEEKARNDPDSKIRPEDVGKEENFPVEYARLRTIPVFYAIFITACVAYGWCLDKKVNIAGPIMLQIVIGYTIIIIMNAIQTLLVDLLPTQSSSVTACNNIVRCSFGAACVSVIALIIQAIGIGWTYVLLSGLCVLVTPLMFIVMRMGPRWRAQRRAKQNAAKS